MKDLGAPGPGEPAGWRGRDLRDGEGEAWGYSRVICRGRVAENMIQGVTLCENLMLFHSTYYNID